MRTDTAHEHWNVQWADLPEDSNWLQPEPDVLRWSEDLTLGASILDLGAGVGRHALALARSGFGVTALDAAPEGLAAIEATQGGVKTVQASMDALPFADQCFDHVLGWNVIYHGDEDVVLRTIAEIRRVLKPGGTYMGTMLSKRRLATESAKAEGHAIGRNTWIFDADESDEHHPHYYCSAAELVALFQGFELMWLEDREQEKPNSWHWHLIAGRVV